MHVKAFTVSTHDAFFGHGDEEHSSMSVEEHQKQYEKSDTKLLLSSREERSGVRSFVTSSFTQSDHQTLNDILMIALRET